MEMNRVKELTASMKSFGKEAYYKSELLDEMFALQQEMVTLTFNEEHSAISSMKIYDVEHYFEELNQKYGNSATKELNSFKKGAITLSRLITAEISGKRGESRAFSVLRDLKTVNRVLTNVELSDRYYRTELDAVVITPSGLTILEVKNTSRNIFIDEDGNFYRNGDYMTKDCNIAQKNDIKEKILREILRNNGINNVDIRTIVVFTDDNIEVHNKCPQVNTAFVKMLCHTIEQFRSKTRLSLENIKALDSIVNHSRCRTAYPADFDVNQFKMDFATLKVKMEELELVAEKHSNKSMGIKKFRFGEFEVGKHIRACIYRMAGSLASVLATFAATQL